MAVYPYCYRTERSQTRTTNAEYGQFFLSMKGVKIKIQPDLLGILHYVDANRTKFKENLAEAVKIKSITTSTKYVKEVKKMIEFVEDWLLKLEVRYERFNIGYYNIDGKRIKLPPIILASLDTSPKKRTVCVYLHLDVCKPKMSQWKSDPFILVEEDHKLYGCGASCGKGPLMCWLQAIQAFRSCNKQLPVNLRFIIESMHHENSMGLKEFISTRGQEFFSAVDYMVYCDSEWLGEKYPCVVYGTAGVLHFQVAIEKTADSKTEIKDDMNNIFETISDEEGKILIPGFYDYVEPVTPDEELLYENVKGFDPEEIRESLPEHKKSWDKLKLLMDFWRMPSIFVDDIEECKCDKQDFSIVKRRFIIKIVPKQIVDKISMMVKKHIKKVVEKLEIGNKVSCELVASVRPWLEDLKSPLYQAARKAIVQIYKENPSMIREERGREIVTIFDTVLERSIIVLPLCCKGSNPAEVDENLSLRNYYEGTKLVAAFLFQVAYMKV